MEMLVLGAIIVAIIFGSYYMTERGAKEMNELGKKVKEEVVTAESAAQADAVKVKDVVTGVAETVKEVKAGKNIFE